MSSRNPDEDNSNGIGEHKSDAVELTHGQPINLEDHDVDQQESVTSLVMSQGSLEIRRGPLPEPSILSDYDKVLPGLADRIVVMAESEKDHRHRMQSRRLELSARRSLIGLISGLVVALSCIILAVWVTYRGYYIAGTIIASIDIVALTAIFVLGAKQHNH